MFTLERQLNTSMSCAPVVAPSVSNWSQLVPIGHGQPTPLGQTKSRGVKGARWFILVTQRVLMGCKETGQQDDGQTGKRRKGEFLPEQQKVMGVSKARKPLGNLD